MKGNKGSKVNLKKFAITLTLALIGCSTTFLLSCSGDERRIKIGAIIPITGPASQHKVLAEALDMAVEEINYLGGINGRKIELLLEDSKSNVEDGKKAFKKMESKDHPLLYISSTSLVSMAIAPLAEENEVTLVGLTVGNPHFTENRKWVFKYYVSPSDELGPIIHIVEKIGIRSLGILYQDDPFGSSHYEYLKEAFEKIGGMVLSTPFNAEKPDFRGKIPSLKQTDAIYIAGFVNLVEKALKQLRAEKYEGVILTHSGATSLPHAMAELDGVYVSAPVIYNPNYVFAREIKEKYESRYSSFFTHQAANGYDFLKILAGLLDGRDLTREEVRAALESEFSYPGILGYVEKKLGEHEIHFPLYPALISDGRITYLQ